MISQRGEASTFLLRTQIKAHFLLPLWSFVHGPTLKSTLCALFLCRQLASMQNRIAVDTVRTSRVQILSWQSRHHHCILVYYVHLLCNIFTHLIQHFPFLGCFLVNFLLVPPFLVIVAIQGRVPGWFFFIQQDISNQFPTRSSFHSLKTTTQLGNFLRSQRSSPVAIEILCSEDFLDCQVSLFGNGTYGLSWLFSSKKVQLKKGFTDILQVLEWEGRGLQS